MGIWTDWTDIASTPRRCSTEARTRVELDCPRAWLLPFGVAARQVNLAQPTSSILALSSRNCPLSVRYSVGPHYERSDQRWPANCRRDRSIWSRLTLQGTSQPEMGDPRPDWHQHVQSHGVRRSCQPGVLSVHGKANSWTGSSNIVIHVWKENRARTRAAVH